jgi:hypothetical protein
MRMGENNKGRIEQLGMASDRTARIATDLKERRAPGKPCKGWLG